MKKEKKEEVVEKATKEKTVKVVKKATKKKEYNDVYDKTKAYSITESLEIVKKITTTKFDSSIEVHLRLGINPKKGDQQVRGAVSLPHGTGKTVRIAAFVSPENEQAAKDAGADLVGGEDLVAEIKKSSKTDFEVAIAEPAMMRGLASIAKILGTRGLMPSPKNDTVTPNIVKAIEELKKGKISFKNDDTANLHCLIGKSSFQTEKLVENFNALIETIRKAKPSSAKGLYIKGASICSSMSRGVKVSL